MLLRQVVVAAHHQVTVVAGQAAPDLTDKMIRRLAEGGFVAPDASVGELGAVVGDLCQRLHYAMGAHDTVPDASPRETRYALLMPTEAAARACQVELIASGGGDVAVDAADNDGWNVFASFPDLPPDRAFRDRVAQLETLARRHGGRYSGSQR